MIVRILALALLLTAACNGPTPPVISCATMVGSVHDCQDFLGLTRDVQHVVEAQCAAQADAGVMATPSETGCDTTGAIGGCQVPQGGTTSKIEWFFPGNGYNDVASVQHLCTSALNGTFVPTPTPGDP